MLAEFGLIFLILVIAQVIYRYAPASPSRQVVNGIKGGGKVVMNGGGCTLCHERGVLILTSGRTTLLKWRHGAKAPQIQDMSVVITMNRGDTLFNIEWPGGTGKFDVGADGTIKLK